MNWQFILIDRDGIETVIDEPVGWDSCEIIIKRDAEKHGAFFDYSGNDFQFYGEAARMIKAENDAYSVQGNMTLVILLGCDVAEELYRGKLLFSQYKYTCGDECFVTIPIETTSDIMEFRNRFDQKVDLQTLKAFDGVTDLPAYGKLGFELNLPSKGILMQNTADNIAVNSEEIQCVPYNDDSGAVGNSEYGMIEIGFDKSKAAEIGGFSVEPKPKYTTVQVWGGSQSGPASGWFDIPGLLIPGRVSPLLCSPLVNYADGMPNFGQVTSTIDVGIVVNGKISVLSGQINHVHFVIYRLPSSKSGDIAADYEALYFHTIHADNFDPINAGSILEFNESYFDPAFVLNKGDRIYLFIAIYSYRTNTEISTGDNAWAVEFNEGNYVHMKTLSRMDASDAKMFMINEAISRTSEAITNDKIRAFSEYFGRTDSQPYSHAQDGPGSLEAITKGLFIRRQENRVSGETYAMNVSVQDIWNGLDPVHHLGMGLEEDINRPGFHRLRVEPWKYFYKDDVIMECVAVNNIERSTIENEHYSTFTFGYDKWEAEEYNGLDEFLTKRIYRTTLRSIKNELSKISKFIASGYALEITRRKADIDSKDWRYDNETFLICCKRNETGDIVVELGNIQSPQNIIDPDTIYNYRISPIRMAMRWLDKVLASYKQSNPANKIIFTDGDGNYFAEGEMLSAWNRLENQVLSEKVDLDITIYADAANAAPSLSPERIEYNYPMSLRDFKNIMTQPHGTINCISNCESASCWIDIIKYKPAEGMANFKLIPKYVQSN